MQTTEKTPHYIDLQGVPVTLDVLEYILQELRDCRANKRDLVLKNPGEISFVSIFGGLMREVLHVETPTLPSQVQETVKLQSGTIVTLPTGEQFPIAQVRTGENDAYYVIKLDKGNSSKDVSSLLGL